VYQEGSFNAALGSAAAPSHSFVGDTNTGMFSPAADTIAFAEGGAEVMRIDSAGNVLVNTTSGTGQLTVNSGSGAASILLTNTNTNNPYLQFANNSFIQGISDGSLRLRTTTAFPLIFDTNSTERMRIEGTGAVVLPKLTLSTDTPFLTGANINSGANPLAIGSTGATVTAFFTNNTERMRIASGGNVGIGTTNPSVQLVVSNAGAEGYEINSTGGVGGGATVSSYNRTTALYTTRTIYSSAHTWYVSTAGTTRAMDLNSSGDLGIGITAPGSRLDVAGALMVNGTLSTGQTNKAAFQYGSNETAIRSYGATTNSGFITFRTGGGGSDTERMRLDASGRLGIGTSPSSALDVNGNIRTTAGSGGTVTTFETDATRANRLIAGADASGSYLNATFGSGGSAILRFQNANTESMRIDASGNLLVGTTTTQGRVSVASATGNVGFNTGTSASPERGNLWYDTDGTGWVFNIGKRQSGAFTSQVTIQDNGNVGVGTTSPTILFQVASRGGFQSDGVFLWGNALTGASRGFLSWDTNIASVNAASILVFGSNGGSERMRITSAGDVGIGTASPNYKLEVRTDAVSGFNWVGSFNNTATGGFGAGFLARSSVGSAYFYMRGDGLAFVENSTNNPLAFATNGLERARIDSTGNFGVGLTNPLEFGRVSVAGSATKSITVTTVGNGTTGSPVETQIVGSSFAASFSGIAGIYSVNSFSSNSINMLTFKTSNTSNVTAERMRIDGDGNVGIGTTSPSSYGRLGVIGNIASSADGATVLTMRSTGGNTNLGSYNATGSTLAFQTNASGSGEVERMRINTVGDVGIGTTAPGGKLEVYQTAATPTIRMFTNFVGGNAVDLNPFITGVSNGGYSLAIGGTIRQVFNTTGDMGIGTTGPSTRLHVAKSVANDPCIVRSETTVSGNNFDYAAFTAVAPGSNGGIVAWGTGSLRAGQVWVQSNGAQPLVLGTNDTERVRIDTAGQVGIGTTPSAWVSSWRAIDINAGGGALFSGLALSGIANNAFLDSGVNWRYKGSYGAGAFSMGSDGSISIQNAGTGVAGNIITFNTRIYVAPAGDIGIGTTGPVSRLNVAGTTALTWVGSGISSGLVTIGDQGTAGGSLFVNTPSLNTSFASGLGIDGSYTNPGGVGTSIVNIKAFGVSSGGGYASDLAFHTAVGTTLSEKFRITSTGAITSSNLADAVGYKGLPQNSQTAAYTLALSDMGKHISITTGGVVIPANGSVAFPIGSAVTIFNNSGSNQTISITTDTLRQAGTANTGSRTLAQYGVATVLKVTSTVWVISGAGVS
jgi:hypothetical protein